MNSTMERPSLPQDILFLILKEAARGSSSYDLNSCPILQPVQTLLSLSVTSRALRSDYINNRRTVLRDALAAMTKDSKTLDYALELARIENPSESNEALLLQTAIANDIQITKWAYHLLITLKIDEIDAEEESPDMDIHDCKLTLYQYAIRGFPVFENDEGETVWVESDDDLESQRHLWGGLYEVLSGWFEMLLFDSRTWEGELEDHVAGFCYKFPDVDSDDFIGVQDCHEHLTTVALNTERFFRNFPSGLWRIVAGIGGVFTHTVQSEVREWQRAIEEGRSSGLSAFTETRDTNGYYGLERDEKWRKEGYHERLETFKKYVKESCGAVLVTKWDKNISV